MSRNIFSALQGLMGATLYHCKMCRFQFHDFRAIPEQAPKQEQGAMSQPVA